MVDYTIAAKTGWYRSDGEEFTCALCERTTVVDVLYQNRIRLCQRCAASTANHYWMTHAGEWLTWKNEPSPQLGRQKAVIKAADRWMVFERDDFRCRSCGDRKHLEVDHVIPESAGGPSCVDNYQTLCATCNRRKGSALQWKAAGK